MVNALACTVELWLHWEGLLSWRSGVPTPYPFIYHFIYPLMTNGTPFDITSLEIYIPFNGCRCTGYKNLNTSQNQNVFLSFSRS